MFFFLCLANILQKGKTKRRILALHSVHKVGRLITANNSKGIVLKYIIFSFKVVAMYSVMHLFLNAPW